MDKKTRNKKRLQEEDQTLSKELYQIDAYLQQVNQCKYTIAKLSSDLKVLDKVEEELNTKAKRLERQQIYE